MYRVFRRSQPGLYVEKSSPTDRFYSLFRSTDVVDAYTLMPSHLPASPPVSSFRDTNALGEGGNSFYRVQVE
jgi:hypothetical protein